VLHVLRQVRMADKLDIVLENIVDADVFMASIGQLQTRSLEVTEVLGG